MSSVEAEHIDRLRTALLRRFSTTMMAQWVTQKTYYGGLKYSFEDHEYQERILSDTSQEKVVRKCSQVGISEVYSRLSVGLVFNQSPYTIAYTLPTAKFAGMFMKTRVNPIIEGSKELKEALSPDNDNNEVKQFGDSFLYVRGAASSNAPISIPCDHLIHDEVDFSDQEVLGQYQSRLTHSKYKRVDKVSTPTVPGYGIDLAFKESRRHFLMCKCNHCTHWFIPDFYQDVVIPGFKRPIRELTKHLLKQHRWEDSVLKCPKCRQVPSLQPEHRAWVCENPNDRHKAVGYQVSPFDAPNIIKVPFLVETSTKYDRRQDFDNFNLGLPSADLESTLTRDDFTNVFVRAEAGTGAYVMGVDVGNTYHFVVGRVDGYGDVFVVHTERVPMQEAKKRYRELRQQYYVVCTVIDSTPHSETVMALQSEDPTLYASVYTRSKSLSTHTVLDKEEDEDKGQVFVRQINTNRNRALDAYMLFVRDGHLQIKESDDKETVITHHISMKRVKNYEGDTGEMFYTWQKTDGEDHFHHAFLYMWLASRVKNIGRQAIQLPVFTFRTFRLKTH